MTGKSAKQTAVIINMIMQFFIETFVGVAIGYFLGRQVDLWVLDEGQVFIYIFMVIGIFAGIRNLIVRALRFSRGGEHEK